MRRTCSRSYRSDESDWSNETPRKEGVCFVAGKHSAKAIKAGWVDDLSALVESGELNPWMMAKLKESHCQARQEDDQRKSVVQQRMQKSTDVLRRIIVLVAVRVPSLSTISAGRLPLVGLDEHGHGSKSKKK